jgi:prevent-host-death family protein
MTTVSVHEAKTHLSRLIERVLAGEEVIVTRNKEPVVRLVREAPPKKKRLLGLMKGRIGPCDNADEPLPDEYLGLDIFGDKEL